MEIIVFLSIVIAVVAVLTSIVLVRRVKKQIAEMTDVLVDVKNGNGNRRILSATNELTAPLAYRNCYEQGKRPRLGDAFLTSYKISSFHVPALTAIWIVWLTLIF